jgi:hypothetical protein
MATAVLIITLLTVVASLASWLFSQWLARRARVSGVALAVGGVGTVLLIGAVALVIVTASTSWQRLMPVVDNSPLLAPARVSSQRPDTMPGESKPAAQQEDRAENPAAATERLRMSARKQEMLASAESHLERSEHAAAVELAREYLAVHPGDSDMRSLLARSLFGAEHPGSASIIPAAIVAEWPATDCVSSTRSDASERWMLDNDCGRVVAVLFASCQLSETACFTNALVSRGWSYEPTGILMTATNDKPVALRLADDGPLVAPIFTIRDVAGVRRQIRYLACEVTAPSVLRLLRTSGGDELTSQRLTSELRADTCYSQVLDWSRSGHRRGASPDALLRHGIN